MKSSNNKENTQNQIFYDKSKVRWPIFLITVGLGITLIIFIKCEQLNSRIKITKMVFISTVHGIKFIHYFDQACAK